MNPKVDTYLEEGCGRCAHYKTPQCKVHSWNNELKLLRSIVLSCGLNEDYKWSQPCYTFNGKNILLVIAFKNYASIAFFKGSLLNDEKGLLAAPGENSQSSRQLRFTNVQDIQNAEADIKAYVYEAIEIEKAGLKVKFEKQPEPIPDELKQKLNEDAILRKAFESLTPGRQRSHILHISQAKQSKTRFDRIEKCIPKILQGKGFNDR